MRRGVRRGLMLLASSAVMTQSPAAAQQVPNVRSQLPPGAVVQPQNVLGRLDLEQKILRHVSSKFSEDPLRVLRGMQFVSRFLLTPAAETVAEAAARNSTRGSLETGTSVPQLGGTR